MLISPTHLSHWMQSFFGYGSWEARFWFIGHEEPGGDLPEEVAEKLSYYFTHHTPGKLSDLRETYRQVRFRSEGPKMEKFDTQFDYRFGPKAIQHGIWKNLITFVHGYQGKPIPDLFEYQRKKFATASGKSEALILLYPLPAPHNHSWYYSWLEAPDFPFLKSRVMYEEQLYPQRIISILERIREHSPELVLMYGMENINGLKQSVQEFFPGAKFRSVKATKLEIPQHHVVDVAKTRLIITTQIPALRHNRVETGFDWEAFGRLVSR